MRIALIGFRGVGKTTVGRELAKLLDAPFADTDAEVEALSGKSVEALLKESRRAFRDAEVAALKLLLQRDDLVISCGGGIVLRKQNRTLLSRRATVVWLSAPMRTVHRRVTLGQTGRTLDHGKSLPQITAELSRRQKHYRASADFHVTAKGSPREIAHRIAARLNR